MWALAISCLFWGLLLAVLMNTDLQLERWSRNWSAIWIPPGHGSGFELLFHEQFYDPEIRHC